MRPEAKIFTIVELCDYLGVHRSTVYRLLKNGRLPGFKIGSDWRFNREEIDRWRFEQRWVVEEAAVNGAPTSDAMPVEH